MVSAGLVVLVTFSVLSSSGFRGTLSHQWITGLTLTALGLVAARHWYPKTALAGMSLLLGLTPALAMLCALIAFGTARRGERPRARDLAVLGCALLPVAVSVAYREGWQGGRWQYAVQVGLLVSLVGVVVPGLVGTVAGQQDRLVRALRERTAVAEQARQSVESESRTAERSRIAAEMHDLVGHRLSLIALHAGGLELALTSAAPDLAEEAGQVRRAGRDAMEELRQVLGVLGPLRRDTGTDVLTDATGTRPDIEALVQESRAAGVGVRLAWEGGDLSGVQPSVRRAVNRVVREALTNVHRYAALTEVAVAVRVGEASVLVEVCNGPPPTPPAATTGLGTGRGLAGLGERISLLDGRFAAGPTADGGYRVLAKIPTAPGPGGPVASGGQAGEDLAVRLAPADAGLPAGVEAARSRLAVGVSALLGLAGLGATLLAGLTVLQHSEIYAGPPPQRVVHLGMSTNALVAVVGPDSPAVRSAAEGREPARPTESTHCVYPYTSTTDAQDRLMITRYCFDGDSLTDIADFTTPLAR
ncbi:sensor histidine kinase [Kitasatospora sp. MMS16-BH015]|nr:sensor histidine kinase [Kitasatospora sp. MMS16-BH015]